MTPSDPEPDPRRSPFDGLPDETREAMELAFVHALLASLRQDAATLNQAPHDPAMAAGHTGRREVSLTAQ